MSVSPGEFPRIEEGGGGEGVASVCALQIADLQGVCPAGTAPELDAAESAECQATVEAGGDLTGAQGVLIGSCAAVGECHFACLQLPILGCECGLERVTAEEFTCRTDCPTVCGDGELAGEEECDLGDRNGTGVGCSAVCKLAEDDCSPNGALRCITPRRTLRCIDATWRPEEDCGDDGKVCQDGDCVTPIVADQDCPVGERSCQGGTFVMACLGDRWDLLEDCGEQDLVCRAGTCGCVEGATVCGFVLGEGEGEGMTSVCRDGIWDEDPICGNQGRACDPEGGCKDVPPEELFRDLLSGESDICLADERSCVTSWIYDCEAAGFVQNCAESDRLCRAGACVDGPCEHEESLCEGGRSWRCSHGAVWYPGGECDGADIEVTVALDPTLDDERVDDAQVYLFGLGEGPGKMDGCDDPEFDPADPGSTLPFPAKVQGAAIEFPSSVTSRGQPGGVSYVAVAVGRQEGPVAVGCAASQEPLGDEGGPNMVLEIVLAPLAGAGGAELVTVGEYDAVASLDIGAIDRQRDRLASVRNLLDNPGTEFDLEVRAALECVDDVPGGVGALISGLVDDQAELAMDVDGQVVDAIAALRQIELHGELLITGEPAERPGNYPDCGAGDDECALELRWQSIRLDLGGSPLSDQEVDVRQYSLDTFSSPVRANLNGAIVEGQQIRFGAHDLGVDVGSWFLFLVEKVMAPRLLTPDHDTLELLLYEFVGGAGCVDSAEGDVAGSCCDAFEETLDGLGQPAIVAAAAKSCWCQAGVPVVAASLRAFAAPDDGPSLWSGTPDEFPQVDGGDSGDCQLTDLNQEGAADAIASEDAPCSLLFAVAADADSVTAGSDAEFHAVR